MNKTILITGSTDGIGKLAAIKLAKNGHQVNLHGRNKQKLDKAVQEVKDQSGNKNIKGFLGDLSDLKEVKAMAKGIIDELPELDVLINNAGIYKSPVDTGKEGVDIRLTVNYLAPYLLTKKLLPILSQSTSTRIINLSSAAQTPASLLAIKGEEKLSSSVAYAQSKLALTMWSFDLAKSLKDSIVIAVNPGSLLNTKMVQEAYGEFWSPAEKGVDILYDLATSDDHIDKTGMYFDNDKGSYGNAHPDAYNNDKVTQLLNTTDSVLANFDL